MEEKYTKKFQNASAYHIKPFCKIHTSLSLLFQKQQFNNNNGNINTYGGVLLFQLYQ